MIMRKFVLLCASLCAMVLLFSASPVQAQLSLWVSPTGNDSNSCYEGAPCLTFQGAINKGNVAEINCLGSGYYGPFTITASITIDCGAGNVGVVVTGGGGNDAITINTGAAATIVLRHLALNGLGTARSGITTPSAFPSGKLIVEDCSIQGFVANGIQFLPSAGRGLLQVSNSQIFGTDTGILVNPSSGQIASVTLNRVELIGNSSVGLFLGGSGIVAGTMRDSIAGSNGVDGVLTASSQVFFTVEESSIEDNLTYGIATDSFNSNVTVTASTISGNGTGVFSNAGNLVSFGNNSLYGNANDGNFTSTTALR
jgi:hypothetical protein